MQRFFIDPALLNNPVIELPERIANQLGQVLRARQGECIVLLDNSGWEYQAELLTISKRRITARIIGKLYPDVEPIIHIRLYQALIRETRMDWVLQKGTELGVSAFVPIICKRSLSSIPEVRKYERWRRIICEAAEQSGRTRLPSIEVTESFERACTASANLRILAALHQAVSLKQILPSIPPPEIAVYIGPEGGFSAAEEEYARNVGVQSFALGKRIMRTETAGLAVAAALIYQYEG